MLPGVESWFSLGNKSRTESTFGEEKVRQVADHVNMILRYIPYVQTNFVFGLDCDEGPEPFALTKKFVDLVPGAFPAYSLLTAFGRAAPLNLEFQRDGRVLSFPHHFLDNHGAMNVRPKNYSWSKFYEHMIDLTRHSFSTPTVMRRLMANRQIIPRTLNVIRAYAGEGRQRLVYYRTLRKHLEKDVPMRQFFEGESTTVPSFYVDRDSERSAGLLECASSQCALSRSERVFAEHRQADASGHVFTGDTSGRRVMQNGDADRRPRLRSAATSGSGFFLLPLGGDLEQRRRAIEHARLGDLHLGDVVAAREIEHDVGHAAPRGSRAGRERRCRA